MIFLESTPKVQTTTNGSINPQAKRCAIITMSLKFGPLFDRSPTIVLSLPMVVSPGLFSSNGFALLSGATSSEGTRLHQATTRHWMRP